MSTVNPYESPEEKGTLPAAPKKGYRFTWTELFVVIAIISVLWLMLLPAKSGVREAARRNQCGSQLEQIGVALRAYQDDYGCLPPAYVADQTGRRMHSWRTLILPYLDDYEGLHDKYDFDKPWNSPENLQLAEEFDSWSCPSWKQSAKGKTTYMLVSGPGTLFEGDRSTCLDATKLRDGGKSTIILAETASPGVTWTEPVDLDVAKMNFQINGGPGEIGSDHSGGVAMVLFADGHVEALPAKTTREKLREMCSAAPAESR